MLHQIAGIWHAVAIVLHMCVCVLLVLIILLQQGKGADAGAAFGGGSNTLFGAGGADTFLSKTTTVLAFLFMTTSFSLALQGNIAATTPSAGRLFKDAPAQVEVQKTSPAAEKAATPDQPSANPVPTGASTEPATPAAEPAPQPN